MCHSDETMLVEANPEGHAVCPLLLVGLAYR